MQLHIYMVPGLAASKSIFKHLEFENPQITTHILEWMLPLKKESLQAYAQRMAARINTKNNLLVGVSFGGILVQEMSQYLNNPKVIIISSIKTKFELPPRLHWARRLRLYKLLPFNTILKQPDLTKFAIGPRSKKRLEAYQYYLSVRHAGYLRWAIKALLFWDRVETIPDLIHLHGTADAVFPIQYISGSETLEGGTHIMILKNAKWVSRKIIECVEN